MNPLQFGPTEDLDKYPRTLDETSPPARPKALTSCSRRPSARSTRQEQLVRVDPGPTGAILEGESRPGFFDGVLTVVLKLFSLVRPDTAVFGQKDAQQLALVRRMVGDFALGIEVLAVPTVRDDDGLALSSRNKYLSPAERAVAPYCTGRSPRGRGRVRGPGAVLAAAQAVLDGGLGEAVGPAPAGVSPCVDYLALAEAKLRPRSA